jgi:hypothetical protein
MEANELMVGTREQLRLSGVVAMLETETDVRAFMGAEPSSLPRVLLLFQEGCGPCGHFAPTFVECAKQWSEAVPPRLQFGAMAWADLGRLLPELKLHPTPTIRGVPTTLFIRSNDHRRHVELESRSIMGLNSELAMLTFRYQRTQHTAGGGGGNYCVGFDPKPSGFDPKPSSSSNTSQKRMGGMVPLAPAKPAKPLISTVSSTPSVCVLL